MSSGGERIEGPELARQAAVDRRAAFVASIPPPLALAEDALPRTLAAANASVRSKLRRIYLVADELGKAREPFVACAKGCSACCHMNVSVTAAEAELLAAASGRKPRRLDAAPSHAPDEFSGTPCPFLLENACSVYEDRPLACRKHASFYVDASPCQLDRMNVEEAPQISFSGLHQALFDASATRHGVMLADIRDFFPPA